MERLSRKMKEERRRESRGGFEVAQVSARLELSDRRGKQMVGAN